MSTEHNPDNLTPEQVGEGWRLLTKEEFHHFRKNPCKRAIQRWSQSGCWLKEPTFGDNSQHTYRTRITPDAGKAEAHEICGNLHCPAAHVTHYQGEHPRCLTCEGHGIIGGYEGSGNDMSPVGYPCPDCNPPAQQPAEAEADIIDHDWQLLSGARVQCAKCGHLTRASDLAMLSSACTGKAQPASEGQQPAEAMPETETPIAYAIYGLDALGRHFLHDVRVPENDDWKSDDGGLGDRWTGNSPLYSIKQELEIRLTAALAKVERWKSENVRLSMRLGNLEAALDGRLGVCPGKDELLIAIQEYIKSEDALPDWFDTEDYTLSHSVESLARKAIKFDELEDQLSTRRAAIESEMRVLREDNEAHVQRCYAAERERDSLATRLAESESREHQAREALDIARKTIADFEDDIPLLDSECVEHIREAVNAIESALTAKSSTTVADLRKRVETAERERDAVVKDRERLEERIRSAVDDDIVSAYIAGASIRDIAKRSKLSKDSIRIMLRIAGTEIRPPGFQPNWRKTRAALATTQETK